MFQIKLLIISASGILYGLLVTPAYAIGNPAQISDIVPIIENTIKLLTPFAAIVLFVMILWGGYKFIFAGDPKSAGQARNVLTYAVVGIILIVVSYLILNLIHQTTGVDVTNVTLPTK